MRSQFRNELNLRSISLPSRPRLSTAPSPQNFGPGISPWNANSELPANVLRLKPNPMNRLPGFDYQNGRPEKIAFLALFVVGLAIVTLAVAGGGSFAVQKDHICQALTSNLVAAAKARAKTTDKPAAAIELKTGAQTAGAPRPGTPES